MECYLSMVMFQHLIGSKLIAFPGKTHVSNPKLQQQQQQKKNKHV